MRKSPIKVKLVKEIVAGRTPPLYIIKEIVGAITLGAYNGQVLRVGDAIDEKQAERLTASYAVTVTRK